MGCAAEVNGLRMYYEIHGTGQPLVLLHGAFGLAGGWAPILPALTENHQVIAVELQGHGHTSDREGPLSFEQMADDAAGLLQQLSIQQADLFGYSLGGTVALAVAIGHPGRVRKLAILGACAGSPKAVYEPGGYEQIQSLPADFAPPMLKDPYDLAAPDPAHWPVLVSKIKNLTRDFKGFSAAELQSIKAETLIMMGDHDGVRPEHAVEMYRQISGSQLAIFPGGDHLMLLTSPDRVLGTLLPFLNAPTEG
jgi:pimeloyl-ACP methyl ester carboxylesterase